MESFELDGIGEIKVRRSANIKYLSIRMSPGRGVCVYVCEPESWAGSQQPLKSLISPHSHRAAVQEARVLFCLVGFFFWGGCCF